MRVIHLGTKIVTTLGVVDDKDNVEDRKVAELELPYLEAPYFQEAFEKICYAREELKRQLTANETPHAHHSDPDGS